MHLMIIKKIYYVSLHRSTLLDVSLHITFLLHHVLEIFSHPNRRHSLQKRNDSFFTVWISHILFCQSLINRHLDHF